MDTPQATILAVDDDETSLRILSGCLKLLGFTVVSASGGVQALELIRQQEFDLLISDLYMPGIDGIMLLKEVRNLNINIPFILVTACGSISSAVTAMRQGADDYLEKPYNPDTLQLTVQRALEYHRALSENRQIKAYLQDRFTFQNIITVCPAMRDTLEMAAKVASYPYTNVAIYGESGTGKEVLARAIHFASTGMPTRFVAVNCAAIPEQLMESELFGHVKGAFTGADREREGKFSQARNGTLLLDEIGDMPLPLQAKLLRALQEREVEPLGSNQVVKVDVRIIAATSRPLAEMVRSGAFRPDLYYRLNVFPIQLPALRDRRDDLEILASLFSEKVALSLDQPMRDLTPSALDALRRHDWPGNIRELANVIEQVYVRTEGDRIMADDFADILPDAPLDRPAAVEGKRPLAAAMDDLERSLILEALAECRGNKLEAARSLGLSRTNLYAKLRKHGIPVQPDD